MNEEEEGRRRKTRRIVARVCVIYVLIRCYRVKAPWPTYTRCVACPYYAPLSSLGDARAPRVVPLQSRVNQRLLSARRDIEINFLLCLSLLLPFSVSLTRFRSARIFVLAVEEQRRISFNFWPTQFRNPRMYIYTYTYTYTYEATLRT